MSGMARDDAFAVNVRWPVLLGYGALALPLAALNLPLYVFLPTFYSAGLGIDLAAVGAVLLLARALDAVLDPLMGDLFDRVATPLGQRRPWLILGTPVLLLASWQLFMPAEGVGVLHLLFWSCLAYVAWTALLLTYSAWGAELTDTYHERSRVTGVREGFVIAGILLAAALPTLTGVEPESREALALTFQSMLVLLPLSLLILLLSVREHLAGRQEQLGFLRGWRVAWANRPFRRLILAFLLNGIANGLPATLFLLFVHHVLGPSVDAGPLLILYFASGMLAVPAWVHLSFRIGKHRAWAASMLWACLVFAWVPLVGAGDVAAFAIICALSGLSLGADLALPASMQADVIDLDRVESGRRRTAFFFALWNMAGKLALALAVGLAFPLLAAVGFRTDAINSAPALHVLTGLYALLPVGLKLAATALVWRFELDHERQRAIRSQIEASI